jgi:hypothetical protein
MKRFICSTLFVLLLLMTSVVAYDIEFSPEEVVARDNPFAQYDDELPSLHLAVMDDSGQRAEDVTITLTVNHVDNLILPSGFPWFQGAQIFSVTQWSETGELDVDALLFPLRGDYTVDVTVMDATGNTESESFMIDATEPFEQSTMNALFFLGALVVFGLFVGLVFGKDFRKKGQSKVASMMLVSLLLVSVTALAVAAHEDGDGGDNYYEDDVLTFYTTPEQPAVGEDTTFTFIVRDADGNSVNNAMAHVLLANDEEGFDVLEMDLFSQTGTFSFDYGIFDGAPHVISIHVEPTAESSTVFGTVDVDVPFAGEASSPPFTAKLIAGVVMLVAMLIGFATGVCLRICGRKGDADE